MQGKPAVIAALNSLLAAELTAIDQYFLHSQMYHNWGYSKIYERVDHERQDEIGHSTKLAARILFLGGAPDVVTRVPMHTGTDVPSMMKGDLAIEYSVVDNLRKQMAICEKEHDYVTRDILLELLEDTEHDHTHWLEQQISLIDSLGLQNYLQSQI